MAGAPACRRGGALPPAGRCGARACLTCTPTILGAACSAAALRLPGTLAVHDLTALIVAVPVGGHLCLALCNEPTRPALEGMTRGTVPAEWARRHHADWKAQPWLRWCPPRRALVAAAVVVLAGLAATVVVARDVVQGDASPPAAGEADR